MPKKPKALDLAGWRKTQIVSTAGGSRFMTQTDLAHAAGCGNSIISRIESGERWPSHALRSRLVYVLKGRGFDAAERGAVLNAMARTWRAYSPDRKGMTP